MRVRTSDVDSLTIFPGLFRFFLLVKLGDKRVGDAMDEVRCAAYRSRLKGRFGN